MIFEKDRWEGVTAFFDAVRTPILIILIVIFFISPQILTNFVTRAGFTVDAVELAGVKLVAKNSSANLDATAAQLAQVTSALADRNKLLGEIAGEVNNPGIKKKIDDLMQSSEKLVQAGQATATAAAQQATAAQSKLQTFAPALPTSDVPGSSLFIFGADIDAASALDEVLKVQRALSNGDATVALFKKGNFYRSVAIFPSDASRNQAIKEIEDVAKRKGTAESLSVWCPAARRLPDVVSGQRNAQQYQC